jgi:hypothetical protein
MVPCGAGVSRQTTPLHKVLPRQARAREVCREVGALESRAACMAHSHDHGSQHHGCVA